MIGESARLRLLLIAPVLGLLATVSFESTRRWTVSATVQQSIDAAAEAATRHMGDVDAVVRTARRTASEARESGLVVQLRETDVEFGCMEAGAFKPLLDDFESATAIRITTTQSYPTVLAPIWGVHEWSVTRSTVRQADALQANRS